MKNGGSHEYEAMAERKEKQALKRTGSANKAERIERSFLKRRSMSRGTGRGR